MPQRFVPHVINKSSKFLICWFILIAHNTVEPIETGFDCAGKSPGFYADDSPLVGCSIYHRCNTRGRKATFHCPEGTLFRQQFLVCAHAREVNCELSSMYYSVNVTPKEKLIRELTTKASTITENIFTEKNSDNMVGKVENDSAIKIQEPERNVVRIIPLSKEPARNLLQLNKTRLPLVVEPVLNDRKINKTRITVTENPLPIVLQLNKTRIPLVVKHSQNVVPFNKTQTKEQFVSSPVSSTVRNSLIKFAVKEIYLISNAPINPSCPLCEPFYLKNGSCTPCIIIK